ncbi:hypothetical protein FLAG1_12141, partial [Fusarium langsethiae]
MSSAAEPHPTTTAKVLPSHITSDSGNGDETSSSHAQDQRYPDPPVQDYHRQQQQQPPPPPSSAHPQEINPQNGILPRMDPDPTRRAMRPCPIRRPMSNMEVTLQTSTNPSMVGIRRPSRLKRRTREFLRYELLDDRKSASSNWRTCKEKRIECKYRDPVPKATDKAQADILEGLSSVQTSLSLIMTHLGRFEQRLIKMESLLPKHTATSTLKTESSVEDEMEV